MNAPSFEANPPTLATPPSNTSKIDDLVDMLDYGQLINEGFLSMPTAQKTPLVKQKIQKQYLIFKNYISDVIG